MTDVVACCGGSLVMTGVLLFVAVTPVASQQRAQLAGLPHVITASPSIHRAAGLWPSGTSWKTAGGRALRDPGTWLPAAGAVIIAAGGWDSKISRWSTTHTPVFGSHESAVKASDDLRLATHMVMVGSAFLPSDTGSFWKKALGRLVWEQAGAVSAALMTRAVKVAVRRTRPDGSDRLSFPSGHASDAFAYTAASVRNFSDVAMNRTVRVGVDATATLVAVGTAWARVEGSKHYPTDVLVGAAVGNAVSVVFSELRRLRREQSQLVTRPPAAQRPR
jgi:hypothetical protein